MHMDIYGTHLLGTHWANLFLSLIMHVCCNSNLSWNSSWSSFSFSVSLCVQFCNCMSSTLMQLSAARCLFLCLLSPLPFATCNSNCAILSNLLYTTSLSTVDHVGVLHNNILNMQKYLLCMAIASGLVTPVFRIYTLYETYVAMNLCLSELSRSERTMARRYDRKGLRQLQNLTVLYLMKTFVVKTSCHCPYRYTKARKDSSSYCTVTWASATSNIAIHVNTWCHVGSLLCKSNELSMVKLYHL